MTIKYAVCQVADTGPLESLAVMLRSVSIEPIIPCDDLKRQLRALGCDTVLDIQGLVSGMGYELPFPMGIAGPADMSRSDVLYVDVKAHRNGPKVWKRWPGLEKRTLWYRINGAQPEHVVNGGTPCPLCNGSKTQSHGAEKDPSPGWPMAVSQCAMCGGRGKIGMTDHGDEINPPCPVLTPNQWYKDCYEPDGHPGWKFKQWAYAFWPPFHRFDEFDKPRCHEKLDSRGGGKGGKYDPPLCLIHRVSGWGYDKLVEPFRDQLGVRMHGVGCPDGLINHSVVATRLSSALAMVHLKSNDAPGYAIYEAMAAACPVVCTRRLIWRSKMQDLLIPGETCLVFDRETHDGLAPYDIVNCLAEVKEHLTALSDPGYNRKVGEAGRERLKKIMWSDKSSNDVAALRSFIEMNFG